MTANKSAGATPEGAAATIELEVEQNSIFRRDEGDVIEFNDSDSDTEVHETKMELLTELTADESNMYMEQAVQEAPKPLGRDQWA